MKFQTELAYFTAYLEGLLSTPFGDLADTEEKKLPKNLKATTKPMASSPPHKRVAVRKEGRLSTHRGHATAPTRTRAHPWSPSATHRHVLRCGHARRTGSPSGTPVAVPSERRSTESSLGTSRPGLPSEALGTVPSPRTSRRNFGRTSAAASSASGLPGRDVAPADRAT